MHPDQDPPDDPRAEPEPAAPDASAGEGPGRKAFLLRLPPELLAELRGWAASELRSLNSHIEYLLRQAVRQKRGERREDV